ncbi:MAG: hypothetical protein ACP5HU_06045 [Phycisphaerae bacterium]
MKPNNADRPAGGAGGSVAETVGKLLQDHSNLLVPAVFIVGIAMVYMLGLRAGPREASAEEQQNELRVESALTGLDRPTDDDRDAESVVRSFYTDTKRRQIPVEYLRRNVFSMSIQAGGDSEHQGHSDTGSDVTGGSSALHQALVRAKALRLQSVLLSEHDSRALISDTLVSEGQTIESWTVTEIRRRSVVLSWNGHNYVLELPQ